VVECVGDARADGFDAARHELRSAPLTELAGGDAAQNLRLLERVLDGERFAIGDAVVLNAAAAIVVAGRGRSAQEGLGIAREQLASGAAKRKFAQWIETARRAR
jgi:anthranilate phosphoribosyltransferase